MTLNSIYYFSHTLKVPKNYITFKRFRDIKNDKLLFFSLKLCKERFAALDFPSNLETTTFKGGGITNLCHKKKTNKDLQLKKYLIKHLLKVNKKILMV